MGDYDQAIEYFQRSLTEHRTPEILTKLREVSHLMTMTYSRRKKRKQRKNDWHILIKGKQMKQENKGICYTKQLIILALLKRTPRQLNVPPKMLKGTQIVPQHISNSPPSPTHSRSHLQPLHTHNLFDHTDFCRTATKPSAWTPTLSKPTSEKLPPTTQ